MLSIAEIISLSQNYKPRTKEQLVSHNELSKGVPLLQGDHRQSLKMPYTCIAPKPTPYWGWKFHTKILQGTTLTFAATCPVGQVRFNFYLPYSNFQLPLKCVCFIMFHLKPSTPWCWHLKAYFFGDKLGCQITKLAHILKSKPETYTAYLPSGASKVQISLALQL